MPLYDRRCSRCNRVEEVVEPYDAPDSRCPVCSGETFRIPAVSTFRVTGASYANGYSS